MKKSDLWTFPVPLGRKAHLQAEEFSKRQVNKRKAKKVYCNTLAILAVNFFLNCMNIETDLSGSDSWDMVMHTLLDVSDIEIPTIGKLECRAVLPEAEVMHVPLEVSSDRIGYIAVRLNESLTEATLLGFTKIAATEEIPLDELSSLNDLLKHLSQIQQTEPLNTQVDLSQWLQNLFEPGWQSFQELFRRDKNKLASGWRGNSQVSEINIERGKVLDLGLSLGNKSVALLVAIVAQVEQEIEVLVQVRPFGGERYLPPGLRLLLFADGEMMKEVISRSQDICIQMNPILVVPGETFSIQVALNEFSVIEKFVV